MKTKALISFAVTAKLICIFVFAYAKCLFSHDAAHLSETSTLPSTHVEVCFSSVICCTFLLLQNHLEWLVLQTKIMVAFVILLSINVIEIVGKMRYH